MKPEYANTFYIQYNEDLHEAILTFKHQYPTDGEEVGSCDVASIVLPEVIAKELSEKLPTILPVKENG